MPMKKCISFLLALCVLLSAFVSVPLGVSAAKTDVADTGANVELEDTTANVDLAQSGAAVTNYNLASNVQDGQILQCWNWSYNNIKQNMEKIAEQGFSAIQTSPIQPIKETTSEYYNTVMNSSWVVYQPVAFNIEDNYRNVQGTKTEFTAMCEEAHRYGVKVVVDTIFNHMANDMSENTLHPWIPSELKDNSDCWHDISMNIYDFDNRYDTTHYCLTGLPDLNTANSTVQKHCTNFMKEAISAGADGFRFDAAKHIETPSDADGVKSDFWPNVLGAATSYAQSTRGITPYYYGEMLGSPGGGLSISAYTQYMSVSDPASSDRVREAVINGNASSAANSGIDCGADPSKTVQWTESHDNHKDNGTRFISEHNINKTWAIVGSRAQVCGMYLARPSNMDTTLMGAADITSWSYPEVKAVNNFKNAFIGQSEYLSSYYNLACVERGASGMIIVNTGGTYYNGMFAPVHTMSDGTYTDAITGNKFTVSNGWISGDIGTTGIAVVYNLDQGGTFTTGQPTEFYLTGSFNSWSTSKTPLVASSSTKASTTMYLDAGTYTFKLIAGELWYGGSSTISDKTSGVDVSTRLYDNITLKATGGTYTFTYDTTTRQLSVSHTSGSTSPIYLKGSFNNWSEDNPMSFESGSTSVTATLNLTAGTYTFKINNSDTGLWYGNNGTIEDTTTTTSSTGWEMYTDAGDCTLNATGGTYTFTFNPSTSRLIITCVSKFTATFTDWDGTVISTQTLNAGATPTAPADPTRTGYTFTGWSPSVSALTSNTTYVAQYKINSFSVSTVSSPSAGGTTSASASSVNYGANVTLTASANTGNNYSFTGWSISGTYTIISGSLTSSTLVISPTSNITATASYVQATVYYTVTVSAGTGGSVSPTSSSVASGSTVTLTATPATGYSFSGWSISGGHSVASGSTSSATIEIKPTANVSAVASFTANTSTIAFSAGTGGSVSNSGSYSITYPSTKSSTATASAGYTFSGWTISGGTAGTDYKFISGSTSSASITLQPLTNNRTITATANFSPNTGTITFVAGSGGTVSSSGSHTITYPSTKASTATANTGYTFKSWTVTGGTAGSAYKFTSGNTSSASITLQPLQNNVSITATANFTINTYTVKFVNYDGTVLSTQTVNHGSAATAPADPTRDGYTFTGWDKDFSNVTSDITVTAMFADKTAYLLGSFNGWSTDKGAMSESGSNIVTATYELDAGTYSFKILHQDVWYGNYGTIEDTTTATSSIGWEMVDGADDCTLVASGGTYTFNYNTSTRMLEVLHETKAFTVTFKNYNGTVISTQQVAAGESAIAPADPTRAATAQYTYTFTGWDTDFTNIQADTVVTATFSSTLNYYTVKFVDWDGTELKTQTVAYGTAATAPSNPSRAEDAGYTYTFSGWDKSFTRITGNTTITALYAATAKSYTVTFVDYNGTVLSTQTVTYGSAATAPTTPTREATAQYTFTFSGWDTDFSKITGNTTVTATYTQTLNKYTVTFKDYDGSVLSTQTVAYGSAATAPTDPVRDGYKFIGWDVPFTNITGNLTVTAVYGDSSVYLVGSFNDWALNTLLSGSGTTLTATITLDEGTYYFKLLQDDVWYGNYGTIEDTTTTTSSIGWEMVDGADNCTLVATGGTYTFNFNKETRMLEVLYTAPEYTVKFVDYNGTVLSTQTIKRGQSATAPADPTRASTAQYTYTFTGWDTDFSNVKSNLTVTATYSQTLNKYTVKFVNWDGTVLTTQEVEYGKAATAPATNPTRPSDGQYAYTFIGWDQSFTRITADTTITAKYTAATNSYTVTFVDYNGEALSSQLVAHGSAAIAPADPTRESTAQYSYTFSGWDTDFSNVTSNLTVKATYTQAVNKYTVKFVNYDGSTLSTQTVEYGASATAPANPTRPATAQYTYTFAGWDGSYQNITSNTTITATYTSTVNKYTVVFLDYNGSIISTQTVEYGKAATAPADPVREGYVFAGWDVSFDYITSNTPVTATYVDNSVYLVGSFNDWQTNTVMTTTSGNIVSVSIQLNAGTYYFKILHKDVWYGNYGNIEDTTITTSSIGWEMAEGTSDCTLTATGGTYIFNYNTETRMLEVLFSSSTHTVTFVDYNGTVLSTQTVATGSAAVAPANPSRASTAQYTYTFAGWDTDFTNVTSDLTVTATYTQSLRVYTVTFKNWDGTVLSTQLVEYGKAATAPETPTRPSTAQYDYTFRAWSRSFTRITSNATITATFTSSVRNYTVTFVDFDGTVIDTQTIVYNSSATAPANPTREATAQYTYTFAGWDGSYESITADTTVTATYTQTVNKYTVTFVDYDGTVLSTQTIEYGSAATAPTAPTRDDYTFTGWDKSFSNITGNTTVTALYTVNSIYLVGSFNNWETNTLMSDVSDDVVSVTLKLEAGTYTFKIINGDLWFGNSGTIENTTTATSEIGWEMFSDAGDCTLNASGGTYTFNFNKSTNMLEVLYTPDTYTVTFVDYNGTVLSTQTVTSGQSATAPQAPTRAATAQYTFTFAGWDTDFTNVKGNLTVTATYTQTVNKYTVTFVDYDGTVLKTEEVEYGASATAPAAPSRESTVQYDYTFKAWSRSFSSITSNATITATYTATIRSYTVTFVDYDGTVIDAQKVEYGSDATAPAAPTREATAQYTYTFTGWSGAYENIKGDTTITATYSQTLNTYTVTFLNWDGTVLFTQEVKYGENASPESTPTRTGYVFSGWDASINNITGDLTVTAQFIKGISYLAGSFNEWQPSEMTDTDGIATITIHLDKGSYSFKVINSNVWYGNGGTIEDTTLATSEIGWEMFSDAGDCTLNASGGTYTFNYNTETRMLEVLFTPDTYTVTFVDYNGTVIDTQTVTGGQAATAPQAPSRESSAQYSYTFSGWDTDFTNVTSDLTVTATYTQTLNKYTVTFKNEDGTILTTQEVEYGKAATAPQNPTKDGTAQYSYIFKAWDTDFSNITANTTVTATYTEVINKYTVTFVNWDGTVIDTQVVEYSSAATAPADPTREGTEETTYTFSGWDKDFSIITGDTTVIAQYSSTANTYTVTFVDHDGKVLLTQEVEHGTAATAPEAPAREATAQYTYTFTGWDVDFDNITANTTVTAVYTQTVNKYTVTFKNDDGTVLCTEEVEYGKAATAPATPSKEADAQYTYTFKAWDADFTNITGDLTVTAVYTQTVNKYTVTFVDYDGTVLSTQTIEYGSAATAPEAPTRAGYTFTGWDKDFAGITGDTIITAMYKGNEVNLLGDFNDWSMTTVVTPAGESIVTFTLVLEAGSYEFKLIMDGEWYGNGGVIDDTTTSTSDIGWEMYSDAGNCTLNASGGTYTFNFNLNTRMLEVLYTAPTYTVTFVDFDGTVLSTQVVTKSEAATAPADPTREGYDFTGWDVDFTQITADTTVTATYAEIKSEYTVVFVDYNGTVLSTQTVLRGESATAPEAPAREADAQYTYTFAGWDKSFDNITKNLTITAMYTKTVNKYTVVFTDFDGTVLSTQVIEYGAAATAPETPTREGYLFTNWDKEFTNITGDLTVTAQYKDNQVYIAGSFNDWTTSVLKSTENGIVSITIELSEGSYTFKITQGGVWYGNDATIVNTTLTTSEIGWEMVDGYGDCTLEATGGHYTFNFNPETRMLEVLYEPYIYTVVFKDYDGTVLSTQTVNVGEAAIAPEVTEREGFIFFGWDKEFDSVKSDMEITAVYTAIKEEYTVTFKNYDGTVLSTQTVAHGEAAVAPEGDPYKEADDQYIYLFAGWDTEFDEITRDTVITAIFDKVLRVFTVTFVDTDGTVLYTVEVEYGSDATAPETNPSKEGYIFKGWDKELTNITADTTITAEYYEDIYFLTGSFNDWATDTPFAKNETDNVVSVTVTLKAGTYYFKLSHAGEWYSNTGVIEDTTITTSEIGWEMFADPEMTDCTLIATGGIYTFNFNPETRMLEVLFTPVEHTVIFNDYDGTQISTQTVSYGAAAEAPADPTREGYIFSGWDIAYDCVTADLIITATYVVDTTVYTVTFTDFDGTVLKTEEVAYGKAATAPETAPTRPGYTFIGWDKEFSKVTGNMTITALYKDNHLYLVGSFNDWVTNTPMANSGDGITYTVEITLACGTYYFKLLCNDVWYSNTGIIEDSTLNTSEIGWEMFDDLTMGDCGLIASGGKYKFIYNIESKFLEVIYTAVTSIVTFTDYDGTVLSTQTVNYGASATAPKTPTREATAKYTYIFKGWDKDYSYITQDTVLTATYDEVLNTYTVTFVDSQGNTIDTQTVQYGKGATAPVAPEVEGMQFLQWDTDFSCITGNTTVKAVYVEAGSIHTVTFVGFNYEILRTEHVFDGTAASAPEAPEVEGYAFKGWDTAFDAVTEDLIVTAIYAKLYTVTFCDENGTVLDTQMVAEGDSAKAPAAPSKDGYAFKGWDKDFSNITGDTTITAVYIAAVASNVTIAGSFNNWDSSATPMYYTEDKSSVYVVLELAAGSYIFKIVNNGEWLGNYGTIDNTTVYTSPVGWEMDPYAGDCTLNATGGTYTFIYNPTTRMLIIEYSVDADEFEVVFMSYDGTTVLSKQTVKKGESAVAPAGPSKPSDAYGSYTFKGWDKDFTNVSTPLTIYPVYDIAPIQFLVKFVDWNGAVLKSEYVGYDGYSGPPADPTRTGYIFTGWDGEFWNVTSNRTIKATYMDNKPKLMGDFNDWSGTSMSLYSGSIYTATLTLSQGWYKFKVQQGWDWYGNNGTIDDTTSYTSDTGWDMATDAGDCTLNATGGTYTFRFNTSTKKLIITYVAPVYTVKFVNYNGALLNTQYVARGKSATPPTPPARSGYIFTGWDGEWWYITGNSTFKANYVESTVELMGDFNGWSGTGMAEAGGTKYTATMVLAAGSYKFKVKVADSWYGNNGTIENATTHTSDVGWEMVTDAGDCTLNTTGGTYIFTFDTSTRMLIIQHKVSNESYTVTFVDHDGTVLSTQTVKFGNAATAPTAPTREGYIFTGWDKDFSYIGSDLTVTAMYSNEPAYLVGTFNDWQPVTPMLPTDENASIVYTVIDLAAGEYKFKIYHATNWYGNDGTIENTTITTSDIGWEMNGSAGDCTLKLLGGTYVFRFNMNTRMLEVLYIENDFTVDFVDHDGTILSTQTVAYGNAAIAPEDPTREGYIFKGWDKSFTSITGDTVITAVYEEITETTPDEVDPDNPDSGETTPDEIIYSASWNESDNFTVTTNSDVNAIKPGDTFSFTVEVKDGYVIKAVIVNMEIITAVDGVYTITNASEDIRILVIVKEDITVEVPDNTKYYTVVFVDANGKIISTQLVREGEEAAAPIAPIKDADAQYTYTFAGWDVSYEAITADTVVTATYTAVTNTYTVIFKDMNGNIIDIQVVEYGAAATAPTAPVIDGYTFKNWNAAFDNITGNIIVSARYSKNIVLSSTGKLKIEVSAGKGFTISIDGGTSRTQGPSYMNSKISIGSQITLTSMGYTSDAKFIGWVNTADGKVLSTSLTYTFVAAGNEHFKAVFEADLDDICYVIFYNDKAQQILDSQYYSSTDAIAFPENAVAAGWDFAGWSMTEAEIQAQIAAGNDVLVTPVWQKQLVYVNLVVNGGTAVGTTNADGKFLANNAVTVTADAAADGMKFAYWVDGTGKIRSFESVYKFFPATDVELTAVFVAEDKPVEYSAIVSVDTFVETGAYGQVTVSWYVPTEQNNWTFVAGGLIAADATTYSESTFYHGTSDKNVYDKTGSTTKPVNTYVWTGPFYEGHTVYVKAWVRYYDENGEIITIYTEIFSATRE